jgi:hypothetical protein
MNEELLVCFYSLYNVYSDRHYDILSFLKFIRKRSCEYPDKIKTINL